MGAVATIIIATALAIAIEHVGRCRLQAAIIIATALAIAIEMLFSGSTTSGAPKSNCTSMHSSLQHHDGIFVGDLHGDWDHARALQHALCSKDGASVKTLYIEPGSPWENGYIESFNARLRDELLNGEVFDTLLEAKVIIER